MKPDPTLTGGTRGRMLNVSFQRLHDAGILTFTGEIGSQHNDDFRSALMLSLSNAERVVVDFEGVSLLDRACIQTFCGALKTAKGLRKDVRFNLLSLKEKIRQNGFLCVRGCAVCDGRICPLAQQEAA